MANAILNFHFDYLTPSLIPSTNCDHHGENALSRLELWVYLDAGLVSIIFWPFMAIYGILAFLSDRKSDPIFRFYPIFSDF